MAAIVMRRAVLLLLLLSSSWWAGVCCSYISITWQRHILTSKAYQSSHMTRAKYDEVVASAAPLNESNTLRGRCRCSLLNDSRKVLIGYNLEFFHHSRQHSWTQHFLFRVFLWILSVKSWNPHNLLEYKNSLLLIISWNHDCFFRHQQWGYGVWVNLCCL